MIVWTITKFKCRDYCYRKLLVVHFVTKQKHNVNAMVQKLLSVTTYIVTIMCILLSLTHKQNLFREENTLVVEFQINLLTLIVSNPGID
jgi:hypothetical protein